RDHGIGISPDDLTRVFDRFWRADPSGAIPGTGLGLSLVKEIVELQDGKVQIESAVGEGTTVTLWFPLTEDFVLSRPSPLQVLPDMD
ncbi:MAG: ATP-binding protein, partial [Curvibacter sp.]